MQEKKQLDDSYWSRLYRENETRWDIGYPSTPLRSYIDQLTDKGTRILVPGCGNAWEAAYLLDRGFRNVTVLDISAELVARLREKFAGKPIRVLQQDFFNHSETYDLILEQTFFCALDPALRPAYAEKMQSLLKPGGKLVGVLFNRDFEGGPPFGGSLEEYKTLFSPGFDIIKMEPCYNSIPPRRDTELFMILRKKD